MKTITLTIILAASVAILRNLAGENVDHGNPEALRPVSAWPWESPATPSTPTK
jgi:hypothetical protein